MIPAIPSSVLGADRSLAGWIRQAATTINLLVRPESKVNSYTVATLPNVDPAGQIILVTDEVGGAVLAFSDGTNWRRVTDRAVVA